MRDTARAFLAFWKEMLMFWIGFFREAIEALLADADPLNDRR